MIVPGWRAVGAMAAGVPIAAACGLAEPGLWVIGPAWVAAVLVTIAADALALRRLRDFTLTPALPGWIEAGREAPALVLVEGRAPPGLEATLEATGEMAVAPPVQRSVAGHLRFTLTPRRRGQTTLVRLHLRWPGPLGLVRRVCTVPIGARVVTGLQVSQVRETGIRLLSREHELGRAVQQERAESMEFHALREFQRGDDRRGINWRQSARHAKMLVRETQAERNRTIMLAIDTGRLMSEPLAGGLPRLDHALNAALVLAYAGLKLGDRVGLFAFGARPVLASGTVRGTPAFGALQRLASELDYSAEETNFTLGLTALGSTLGTTQGGRALVIVMTEFADPTGAELMLENVGRLMAQHLVLFIAFQDDELAALAEAEPRTPDDVARAVVAGSLLAERELVLTRLRRMGVEVLSPSVRELGPALISRYLTLKRQDRI